MPSTEAHVASCCVEIPHGRPKNRPKNRVHFPFTDARSKCIIEGCDSPPHHVPIALACVLTRVRRPTTNKERQRPTLVSPARRRSRPAAGDDDDSTSSLGGETSSGTASSSGSTSSGGNTDGGSTTSSSSAARRAPLRRRADAHHARRPTRLARFREASDQKPDDARQLHAGEGGRADDDDGHREDRLRGSIEGTNDT